MSVVAAAAAGPGFSTLGIRDKPSSSSSRSAIVGIVVGGSVFLGLILILCLLGLRAGGKHKQRDSKVLDPSNLSTSFGLCRNRSGRAVLDHFEGQPPDPVHRQRRSRRRAAVLPLDSTASITPATTTASAIATSQQRERQEGGARPPSAPADSFQVIVERLDDEGGVALLTRRLEEEAQRSRARRHEALYAASVAAPGLFVRPASVDVARHQRRTTSSTSSSPPSASAWRMELSSRRGASSRGQPSRDGARSEELPVVGESESSATRGVAKGGRYSVAMPRRAATAGGSSSSGGCRRLSSVSVPAYQAIAPCLPASCSSAFAVPALDIDIEASRAALPGEGHPGALDAGFEALTRSSTMLPTSPPPAYASVDCRHTIEHVEVPVSRSW